MIRIVNILACFLLLISCKNHLKADEEFTFSAVKLDNVFAPEISDEIEISWNEKGDCEILAYKRADCDVEINGGDIIVDENQINLKYYAHDADPSTTTDCYDYYKLTYLIYKFESKNYQISIEEVSK